MQVSHIAHDLHSVSRNAAVSGATAPKPPTNLCALIARFILTQMPARGEAESDESIVHSFFTNPSCGFVIEGDGERNANVQELSEASDQAIQKQDLALKDSLSGISQ